MVTVAAVPADGGSNTSSLVVRFPDGFEDMAWPSELRSRTTLPVVACDCDNSVCRGHAGTCTPSSPCDEVCDGDQHEDGNGVICTACLRETRGLCVSCLLNFSNQDMRSDHEPV